MGNEASTHEYDGCTTLGYRVLGVQPNSPASKAGLVSFFDFLVGVNGQLLFDNGSNANGDSEYFEDLDFVAIIKDNVDTELELLVWNIKSKTQRFISLTPTTKWEGQGLLGVTIRMDDYSTAEDNLLRCLYVTPNSPAAQCGLIPNTDYLLGTTMESLDSEEVLEDILYEHEGGVLELYVYNTETDVVRVVTLMPNRKWGGSLLGAEVGRGYLHKLPQKCRSTLGKSFERKLSVVGDHDEIAVLDKDTVAKGNNTSIKNTTQVLGKLEISDETASEPSQAETTENTTSLNSFPMPPTLSMGEIGSDLNPEKQTEGNDEDDDLPPPPIADVSVDPTPDEVVDLR